MELPDIMREAQQALNGDYEQFIMRNQPCACVGDFYNKDVRNYTSKTKTA